MKYKATGMQLYNRGFFVCRSASSVGRSVGPSIGPSVRRLVRLSFVPNMFLRLYRHATLQSRLLRPSVCFVGRSVRQSVGRSVGRSVGWSVSRLCFFLCVFCVPIYPKLIYCGLDWLFIFGIESGVKVFIFFSPFPSFRFHSQISNRNVNRWSFIAILTLTLDPPPGYFV